MSKVALLNSLLASGRTLRRAEADIYSAITAETERHSYDRTAVIYDLLIGNKAYNRVVWGNWPSAYAACCSEALASSSEGLVLDAGCGTLIFTASAYLRHASRPVVLLDRSLGMLRKARARLLEGGKSIPDHIILLQGDMSDLPFRAGCFETILSWGTLHLFGNPARTLKELDGVTTASGRIFISSLVTGSFVGDLYLKLLFKTGEMASPMSVDTLISSIVDADLVPTCSVRGNMAYCVAAKPQRSEASSPGLCFR